MNEQILLFVFAKNKVVKVLTLSQCEKEQVWLKEDDWEHTATIDARVFIEHIANDETYKGENIDELRGCFVKQSTKKKYPPNTRTQ